MIPFLERGWAEDARSVADSTEEVAEASRDFLSSFKDTASKEVTTSSEAIFQIYLAFNSYCQFSGYYSKVRGALHSDILVSLPMKKIRHSWLVSLSSN